MTSKETCLWFESLFDDYRTMRIFLPFSKNVSNIIASIYYFSLFIEEYPGAFVFFLFHRILTPDFCIFLIIVGFQVQMILPSLSMRSFPDCLR
jgi:membrane-bound metal-dependent hydrolase YbcI (DUF457 family)